MKPRTKKAKIDCALINPKSVTIDELYGRSDPNTLEWTDGLLANAIRQFINSNKHVDIEVLYNS
jgi:dynein heavy chain